MSMLHWKLRSGFVLHTITDPTIADTAEGRDHQGGSANHIVCRRYGVPYGTVAYSTDGKSWLDLTPEMILDRDRKL